MGHHSLRTKHRCVRFSGNFNSSDGSACAVKRPHDGLQFTSGGRNRDPDCMVQNQLAFTMPCSIMFTSAGQMAKAAPVLHYGRVCRASEITGHRRVAKRRIGSDTCTGAGHHRYQPDELDVTIA